MKLKQEQFDKLDQLDRIEFRQIVGRIEKYYEYDFYFYKIVPIILILDILVYLTSKNILTFFMYLRSSALFILVFTGLDFILFGLMKILKDNKFRKLEEKYFEIKIKNKKR